MFKFIGSLLVLSLAGQPLFAQQPADSAAGTGRCAQPDTVIVTGNSRVDEATIRGTAGILPHATINAEIVQRAIKSLFSSRNFDDVKIVCSVAPTQKVTINIAVKERPTLASTVVRGTHNVSQKDVKGLVDLPIGSVVDPADVAKAVYRADSLYESKGYYLAKIRVDSTVDSTSLKLAFDIDEGHRMSVSGVQVQGNQHLSASEIVGAMQTKPEGFFWFRNGEFDEDTYATDLTKNIPELYGGRGFIDFRVLRDTMIVDRSRGKGELQLMVDEGPRYTIGQFEVLGNRYFQTDALKAFYSTDGSSSQSLAQSALGFIRRTHKNPPGTFDEKAWEAATEKLKDAYYDQGYIYANINPIEERVPSSDSVRKVNLRWEIDEGAPAIINRVDITGNDFTEDACIRQQIVTIPGDVFRRDYLIRSYQNISNMNFFEQPMDEPDVKTEDSTGNVDITYKVKEKRTGNINFGASMGEGTGLGGFIGLDQPNLFGRCKRAQVQWQFGKYQNNFTLTYQDPNIRQTNVSGSITGYDTRTEYEIADLGQSTRIGAQAQLGFPVKHSIYSRFYVSYGGERVKYDDNTGTLLGTLSTTCNNCFRSSVGLTYQHDTRVGLPFPTGGGMQSVTAEFDGGPLGGTASFQRYMTDLRSYTPLAYIGSTGPGSQPMTLLMGLSAQLGALVGNPGPFFSSESFAMGGTQYGEPLRGYCEFSITPAGYNPSACDGEALQSSFGNAFFLGTAELGFRINQMFYLDGFFEGGNVWAHPQEINPTRLFRSVGFGGSIISPLGPLGLDIAYGLDRVDAAGRPDPGWKVHFKLGQANF